MTPCCCCREVYNTYLLHGYSPCNGIDGVMKSQCKSIALCSYLCMNSISTHDVSSSACQEGTRHFLPEPPLVLLWKLQVSTRLNPEADSYSKVHSSLPLSHKLQCSCSKMIGCRCN